ncbi:hypothetical protein K435DRAFT_866941 [Dendrothele bispora CBS 962.96]|uniref:Uncharacterized protein n=1 Tax=Dendrothele bispora (strain CBS 962.96) TaxID=1314807 RepID=A0A4S8LG13_DENBC|nr:hypothetical protein K435DRAFT_866941 [Dendrothele bispora CBS 962.96]
MPASRNSSTKHNRKVPTHPYKPHQWQTPHDDFLRMMQPPIAPAYFISDDEELKAAFLIRCQINLAIESQLVPCAKEPGRNHLVSISRKGILEIECNQCDVEDRCRFMSIVEEIQLQSALRQWRIFAVQRQEMEEYRRQFWELVAEVEEECKMVKN